jgi:hypothetical protein
MSFPTDDSKLEAKHLIQKFNNGPKVRYHEWRRRVEFALRDKTLWVLVIGEKKKRCTRSGFRTQHLMQAPKIYQRTFLNHKVGKTLQYLNQY